MRRRVKPQQDHQYALERLYIDQDRQLVIDAVPAVLAWVPASTGSGSLQPFSFRVELVPEAGHFPIVEMLHLGWDVASLRRYDPQVQSRCFYLAAASSHGANGALRTCFSM